jgi:hypothetical protein
MQRRPSHKENSNKLRQAVEALASGHYLIANVEKHFQPDMQECKSSTAKAHFALILALLQEIHEAGGADCYAGAYPPLKCYEKHFENDELFAFAWESKRMKKRMYLKFGIRLSKTQEPRYIYLNCHEDQPEKKNR